MKIAIPITASNIEDALKDIEEASEVADVIELRIDYMNQPDLERLLSSSKVPIIVTNRARNEGGHFKGTEKERLNYLKRAISLRAAYVDIELSHYVRFKKRKKKVIVSYHNFDETPANLYEIYQKLLEKNEDIVKIVTQANTEQDVNRMIELLEDSEADMIEICMGELGQRTRLHSKNYLTFASLNREKESAPGQFTIEEIKRVLSYS